VHHKQERTAYMYSVQKLAENQFCIIWARRKYFG